MIDINMYLVQERLRQRSAPLYKHLMLYCLTFFTLTEFPSVIKWILDLAILSIFVGSKEIQFCPYVLQRKKSAANNTNFLQNVSIPSQQIASENNYSYLSSADYHLRRHYKYHFFIPTQIYLVITINLSKMKDEVSNPL